MSVTTHLAALSTLSLTVTGIRSAPTDMPAVLNNADLPIMLWWPGAAQWTEETYGQKKQLRTYMGRCFVAPLGLDRPIKGGFLEGLSIIQAMGEALLADPTLGDTVDTVEAGETPITDKGMGIVHFPYDGTVYHGFEVQLVIKERYG